MKAKKMKRPSSASVSDSKITLPPMEDWISALPDEILRYILSFLPTKLALTTSVLSKRWIPISSSLTTLHFDDGDVQDQQAHLRLRRFVHKLLLSSPDGRLETFCFMSLSKLCSDHFSCDDWVEAAKWRGVKNLQLSTKWWNLYFSPNNIFNSKTLVVLKLGEVTLVHQVGSVDLPSLTTLHLMEVLFQKKDDFKKLLTGCPSVVDLYVVAHNREFWNRGYTHTTGYKNFPKVVKAHIRAFDVPFTAIHNVESLCVKRMEYKVKDNYINSYYRAMPVFRNLINLEMCFQFFRGWDDVVEVLPYCPKLQSLCIVKHAFNAPDYVSKLEYTEPVPECVSSHLRTCSIGIYQVELGYDVDDFKFAAYIMQNSRLLQVMTLHINPDAVEYENDRFFKRLSLWCQLNSPTCKIECKSSF